MKNTMINWTKLNNPAMLSEPFRFCLFTDLIIPDKQLLLQQNYPALKHFTIDSRVHGDKKHYKFGVLSLIKNNKISTNLSSLAICWKQLTEELMAEKYINCLSPLLDEELTNTNIDISLFRFPEKGWVAPHIDNHDKVATQIFYFNQEWSFDWGGWLGIMKSKSLDSLSLKIPPLSCYSALIPRNEKAWHMVEAVSEQASYDRLTLQMEFWRKPL